MLEASIISVLVLAAAAAMNWQRTIFLVIVTAVTQDLLRKLTPGQPVFFILFCGVVLAAGMIAAYTNRVSLDVRKTWGWRKNVGGIFIAFLLLCAFQALNSLLRFGNPVIPVLGAISYLAAFPALAFAYQFARKGGVKKLVNVPRFYLLTVIPAILTIYLQASGMNLPVFGEVGPGITIYAMGGILQANCGIFRASEIAAWHVAAAACFTILVLTEERPTASRVIIAVIITGLLIGIGVSTGRRKFVVTITIFLCAYMGLMAIFLRGSRKILFGATLLGLIAYVSGLSSLGSEPADGLSNPTGLQSYMMHTSSVFGESADRFVGLWTITDTLGLRPFWDLGWRLRNCDSRCTKFHPRCQLHGGRRGRLWEDRGGTGYNWPFCRLCIGFISCSPHLEIA